MTNEPIPTPADKLLIMLDEDEIELLPLDVVKERLHEYRRQPHNARSSAQARRR